MFATTGEMWVCRGFWKVWEGNRVSKVGHLPGADKINLWVSVIKGGSGFHFLAAPRYDSATPYGSPVARWTLGLYEFPPVTLVEYACRGSP